MDGFEIRGQPLQQMASRALEAGQRSLSTVANKATEYCMNVGLEATQLSREMTSKPTILGTVYAFTSPISLPIAAGVNMYKFSQEKQRYNELVLQAQDLGMISKDEFGTKDADISLSALKNMNDNLAKNIEAEIAKRVERGLEEQGKEKQQPPTVGGIDFTEKAVDQERAKQNLQLKEFSNRFKTDPALEKKFKEKDPDEKYFSIIISEGRSGKIMDKITAISLAEEAATEVKQEKQKVIKDLQEDILTLRNKIITEGKDIKEDEITGENVKDIYSIPADDMDTRISREILAAGGSGYSDIAKLQAAKELANKVIADRKEKKPLQEDLNELRGIIEKHKLPIGNAPFLHKDLAIFFMVRDGTSGSVDQLREAKSFAQQKVCKGLYNKIARDPELKTKLDEQPNYERILREGNSPFKGDIKLAIQFAEELLAKK